MGLTVMFVLHSAGVMGPYSTHNVCERGIRVLH